MTPPPRYKVSQWSETFRYLSREYSASPGRYSLEIVPYAREPLDAANDPTVRAVVLMWASQTTKSTILENVCGYFIAADPSPILLIQPTVEMAQAWSKERFVPTVRDTPVLRDVLSDAKSRDSGNTIQLKTFPGGNLAIIGANAPAGLAGRPRRVVLLDEVDRYPASAGTEGDPVLLAIRRTESFYNSVIYLTSTPTVKGLSRIENEFEQTDKRHWFVPCPFCGESQTLKWSGVKWPQDKPEDAFYECEHCQGHWTDADRVAAIRKGEWRATAPFTGKRGYFITGIYSPFRAKRGFKSRLHQMALEFLEAKRGGAEQLKTWTNTFLAETWQDEGESVEPSVLTARCEPYTPETLPIGCGIVCGGADVQKDRIELEWVASGLDDESWGVEVVKTYGDTEKPDTWERFSKELTRKFRRADGVELSPVAVAVDFHYKPKIVKMWSLRHGTHCRIMLVIGVGDTRQPNTTQERTNQGYRYWTLATDPIKDTLFSRMRIDSPGPRFMHFPIGYGYTDEWFRQLTSERAVTKYTRGFPKRVYEKLAGARNEALDMRVYWMACLEILRPNIGYILGTLKPKQPEPQTKPTQPQPRPVPFLPKRQGWVGGWR